MDSGTLSDPQVDAYVRQNFIAVRLEKEHHAAAFDELAIKDFPTTIVMRADRTEVSRTGGALAPKEFLATLQAATAVKSSAESMK